MELKRLAVALLLIAAALLYLPASAPTVHAQQPSQTISGWMNVTCFSSPDNSYQVLVDVIRTADTSLFMEMYMASNPYILDELVKAVRRGVNVVAIFEKDHYPETDEYTLYFAYNLSTEGARVYWAPDDFTYLHAKVLIVDNKTTVVMSCNLLKTGVPVDSSYGNREWGIAVTSEEVASYYLSTFLDDLSRSTPYSISDGTGTAASRYVPSGSYSNPEEPLSYQGQISVTTVLSPENSEDAIKLLLSSAERSIDVEQLYIKELWGSERSPFLEALIAAAESGIRVRVILNDDADNRELANYLAEKDIFVAVAKDIFEAMHNKGVVVDGEKVLVSSINWGVTSVRENREAGIIVNDAHVASYYSNLFERDWKYHSTMLSPPMFLEVVSPSPNAKFSGVCTVKLKLLDAFYDGANVTVYVDDQLLEGLENIPLPNGISDITIDSTLIPNGQHVLKFVARDQSGVSESVELPILVENETSTTAAPSPPAGACPGATLFTAVAVALLLAKGRRKQSC